MGLHEVYRTSRYDAILPEGGTDGQILISAIQRAILPHQIMSFAAPLGVGITSDGEYFDIDVNTTESTEKSIAALNAQMVDGVEVTGYVLLPDDAKKAMSLVAAADYVLSFKDGYESPYTIEEWKDSDR